MLKAEHFTESAGLKATIASGVVATDWFGSFCAGFGGCTLIPWFPDLVLFLMAMVALDMLSGVLRAGVSDEEELESREMGDGMRRKLGMFLLIAAAVLIEGVFLKHGQDLHGWLSKWTTSWFIAVEALSLYENASDMGISMPGFFKKHIERLLSFLGDSEDAKP